jgi:hypothetical protein
MTKWYLRTTAVRRAILAGGIALGVGLFGPTASAVEGVDAEAEKVLRAMSSYLGGLQSFTVKGDVDDEIVDLAGQKLQLSSSASLAVQRPNHFYAHRQTPLADIEAFFDGQTLTLHGKGRQVYVQFEVPGTIDEAVTHLRAETGLDAPAGDLFYADPLPGLMTDVMSGTYFGTAYVNGTECHHLAFRAAKVDWQIWVQTGDRPLPMKYVITSKWITGAPSYSVRFRDWDTEPAIAADRFKFVPAEGTKRLEAFPVDVMGGLLIEGKQ